MGPNADSFKCGSFYNTDDNRIERAVLHEDPSQLVLCGRSFQPGDWTCVSCPV